MISSVVGYEPHHLLMHGTAGALILLGLGLVNKMYLLDQQKNIVMWSVIEHSLHPAFRCKGGTQNMVLYR